MTDTHPYARGGGSTRRRWVAAAGIGLLGGPLLAGWMLLPNAAAVPADKVQICHATGSDSNPYIVTQVDVSSVDEEGNQFLNGHGDHTGPVFDPDDPQDSWGDIIPPITNPDTGTTFDGLNWPAGEDIWLNGCQVPTSSPTPTETSPTPTETSPTPTETTVTPSPGTTSPTPTETSATPTTGTPTTTTLSPSPAVTITGTGLPTGVAAGGGPIPPLPGAGDPLRPNVLWAASAGLTAMGLLALARVRRMN